MMLLGKDHANSPKSVKEISNEYTGNYYLKITFSDARNSELEFVGNREDFEGLKQKIDKALSK